MQIALVVAAHEFPVGGKCDVALLDAGSHPCASLMTLLRVLGKLERPTPAVANGKVSLTERGAILALLKFLLQRALVHLFSTR